MRIFPHLGASALLAGLLGLGCGVGQEPVSGEDASEDEGALGAELSAKAPGITLWLDPVAQPTTRFDQPAWVLRGRTSKNLSAVFSFSSDDEFAEAIQVSPRKFEVFMDAAQAEHLMAGYRLLLDIDASSGDTRQYFASIRIAPRFDRFHGSSKVTLHKTVTPFVFGSEIRYRNIVGFAAGFGAPAAETTAGDAPLFIGPSGSSWAMDWGGPELLAVAQSKVSEIAVSASSGSQTVTKSQGVDLIVKSLQLTTDPRPLEHWPDPSCKPSALACLQALPAGTLDRSSCGSALEVWPCISSLDLLQPDAARFQSDLRSHLVSWYADHGADVQASGGNALSQAQALCSVGSVEEVTDAEEDPEAHDLGKFIVFRHPDVVWPGSDIVWFGAYDRSNGQLQSIYDFN